jgi:NAD+ dependent glucose-6-phosphate dehydrogenase
MHILLTGAAGRIGTAFYAEVVGRHRFRLADRVTDGLVPRDGDEVVSLDVADVDGCHAACAGIDSVIHLAADPRPEADFYGSLLKNNIEGTFNIFRAAKDAGAQRAVYASSIHAAAGYPQETPIPESAQSLPITIYGATKCFGEALAAYFAQTEGLSSIAVRIGSYDAPWIHADPTPRNLMAYVSARDLNQLLLRAVEAPPGVMFAIVNGQSNNRIKRMDIAETRRILGYEPQDDGFAMFGLP